MGLTFIVLLFFLATLSVSYAMWTEDTQINGTIGTMEDFNYLCLEGYWALDETSGTTAPDLSINQVVWRLEIIKILRSLTAYQEDWLPPTAKNL